MRSIALVAVRALALSACEQHHQPTKNAKQMAAPQPKLAEHFKSGSLVWVNTTSRTVTPTPPKAGFNPNDPSVISVIDDTFVACRDKIGPYDPADTKKDDEVFDCINRQIELGKNNFQLK
jgi:hypothetical protein